MVVFRGTLSEADMIPGWNHVHRGAWHVRALAVVMGLFLLATIGDVVLNGGAVSLFGVLFPAMMLGWLWWGARLQLRSQMKQLKHMTEEGTYEFDEAGFRILRPSLDVKLPWTAIVKVKELPGEFLLFTAPLCFHVIPKRFIDGETQAAFRELLARRK